MGAPPWGPHAAPDGAAVKWNPRNARKGAGSLEPARQRRLSQIDHEKHERARKRRATRASRSGSLSCLFVFFVVNLIGCLRFAAAGEVVRFPWIACMAWTLPGRG